MTEPKRAAIYHRICHQNPILLAFLNVPLQALPLPIP